VRLGLNWFRNDVSDLIESVSLGFVATPSQLAQVVAREGLDPSFRPVLGRLLFTYRNVDDVVTSGVELDGDVAVTSSASVGWAYTYLDAVDGEGVPLTGRHAHQGHIRGTWRLDRIGLRANLRGTFYGSWIAARTPGASGGFQDTIAPRFALWDAYVSKDLVQGVHAFAAVDNLADSRDPNSGLTTGAGSPAAIYRPEIGRTFRIGVRWGWEQR
jgi:outer membrane receptor for ferrienterochelin and colicin